MSADFPPVKALDSWEECFVDGCDPSGSGISFNFQPRWQERDKSEFDMYIGCGIAILIMSCAMFGMVIFMTE